MADTSTFAVTLGWAALHARRNFKKKAFKRAVLGLVVLTVASRWGGSAGQGTFALGLALPFLALFFGGGVLREEIEDQTLTYAFTRPIGRGRVYVARAVAAMAPVFALAVPVALMAGLRTDTETGLRYALAAALGVPAYLGFFALLGLFAKWSTTVGVLFVLFWESLVAQVPGFLGRLTIGAHVRGIAGLTPEGPMAAFVTLPGAVGAAVTLLVVAGLTLSLGALWVQRAEIVLEKT